MAVLGQFCTWPGVDAVDSCEYTAGHGITPGRAILVTYPQSAKPAEYGDLVLGDGIRSATLKGCKVETFSQSVGADGTTYTLEISDRRWSWAYGGISGSYNLKDDHGKLVPWSIRSPRELAVMLLEAMGERGYVIDLPEGLRRVDGVRVERLLKVGENYPQTLTNPEQIWDRTVPAQALARLVELWGRRVVFQPFANRTIITQLGRGLPFPNLPSEAVSANVNAPAAPKYLAATSREPVKFQMRFLLEPVGEEWDGSYVPINQLSYSPIANKERQVTTITEKTVSTGLALGVKLSFTVGIETFERYYTASTGGATIDKLNRIAKDMNATPEVRRVLTATVPDATTLRLAGIDFGQSFSVTISNPDGSPTWAAVNLISRASAGTATWAACPPPSFLTVQATDRLSVSQARELAGRSVWKCFRILARDPSDKKTRFDLPGRPLFAPGLGLWIKRRQQVILQSDKVEQVIPVGRIPGAVNKANRAAPLAAGAIPNGGVLPEYYNGYSRSQPATVTGSVYRMISGSQVFYFPTTDGSDELNTPATDRVFIPFSINAAEQMVVFSDHVYRVSPNGAMSYIQPPTLVLETGCYLMDAVTSELVKWEEFLRVPGGVGPTEWVQREDMKVGVVGRYKKRKVQGLNNDLEPVLVDLPDDTLTDFYFDGVDDAKARAGYYLRGQAVRYQIKGGEVRQYVGIIPHDLDGFCQQATIRVGPGGASTIVAGNTEYHPTIAQYPARRRNENLPASEAAKIANLAERALWDENVGDSK